MPQANADGRFGLADLKALIERMYSEWGVLSISDLVYNHMAIDSPFLLDSPDSAFNMRNSPHLMPAFVLDRVFHHFTMDIANGLYEARGIARGRIQQGQLDLLRHIVRSELVPRQRIAEFFACDLQAVLSALADPSVVEQAPNGTNLDSLHIVQDEMYRRLGSTVNLPLAKALVGKLRRS